jgi:hypothetical protein
MGTELADMVSLGPEHQRAQRGMLTVGSHDDIELTRRSAVELDTDRPLVLPHGTDGVAEHHLGVVGDRIEQNADKIVAHDLDLAITAGLVQRAKGDVVRAAAIRPHHRQRHDPGVGVPDGLTKAHPLDHVERRATDVDGVPAHPQSVHPLHQHRPMSTAVQPMGECRARDAGTRDQNAERTVHASNLAIAARP